MSDTNISGQGYLYGSAPKATNPFFTKHTSGNSDIDEYVKTAEIVEGSESGTLALHTITLENGAETEKTSEAWNVKGEAGAAGATPDITINAAVSDTTGTPAVSVSKTGTAENPVFGISFSGLKGAPGADGKDGTSANINGLVSDVSVTNENGVYTLKQTKKDSTAASGTIESEIGTIEVPQVDTSNVLAEITDSVVEDNTNGYDFHTIKETEYNGTQNEVGKFYVPQKQPLNPVSIASMNPAAIGLSDKTVGQDGTVTENGQLFSYIASGRSATFSVARSDTVQITSSLTINATCIGVVFSFTWELTRDELLANENTYSTVIPVYLESNAAAPLYFECTRTVDHNTSTIAVTLKCLSGVIITDSEVPVDNRTLVINSVTGKTAEKVFSGYSVFEVEGADGDGNTALSVDFGKINYWQQCSLDIHAGMKSFTLDFTLYVIMGSGFPSTYGYPAIIVPSSTAFGNYNFIASNIFPFLYNAGSEIRARITCAVPDEIVNASDYKARFYINQFQHGSISFT